MNALVLLVALLIGLAIAFAIPVMVTNFFVNDMNLAMKIVFANFAVTLMINKLLSPK